MGLTAMLARQATRTAHVLVVEAPGGWLARVALEQEIGARGWRIAASPADADVLAVCGTPGPELAGLVDRVWDQLPGPRARIQADTPAGVGSALDTAAAGLLDSAAQREDGLARPATPDAGDEHEGMDHGEMDHGGLDHGGMDHEGMDHGGMDHGEMDHGGMDHGEMDHGGMDMAPAGIPLAGGGEDRDGLEMDVLHVSLGPVLPHWPAGLVLRCALQGDVVVDAEARLVDHGSGAHQTDAVGEARDARAVRWDAVASLLALAGWADGAARARRVRDLVLATGVEAAAREAEALRRRIGRSRLLRWTLRGVGPVSDADVHGHRVPAALAGDTHTRLLDQVRRALDPDDDPAPLPVDALPALVRGLDLATARLVVASVAADLDLRERTHAGTAHG